MKKISVLITYNEMMVGGSTTSLLAFLNCIDKEKYDVDIQLYKNRGPLFGEIPEGINVLPEAFACSGKMGGLVKKAKFLLTGAVFKARRERKKIGKSGFSGQVMSEFQAKHLSRKATKRYDIAIGFMEGWPDKYIAFCVEADKKIGWMHNTFANIAEIPHLEKDWMAQVDRIVFVADSCTKDFCISMPEMSDKAVTILNITDSQLINKRSRQEPIQDEAYEKMIKSSVFKLVTVCRMSLYHKGLDRIVWCAKQMRDDGKKFLWTIVGDGPDFKAVEKMISDHNLSEQVVMIGNRLNPLPYIKAADIFCMPSRYEGKPMVITESMILGTPPVVTEYLSAHEQISSGTDGIVINNNDLAIIDAVEYCIDNPSKVAAMREYLLNHEYGNKEYMLEIENELFI